MNNLCDSLTTYLVGRSAEADIVIGDATVSRLHAELVRGKDGTWYLTDRGSTRGTYLQAKGTWVPVKQDFVRPGDRLMLGAFKCVLDDLLRRISRSADAGFGSLDDKPGVGSPVRDERPDGPVRRDAATGDILSADSD